MDNAPTLTADQIDELYDAAAADANASTADSENAAPTKKKKISQAAKRRGKGRSQTTRKIKKPKAESQQQEGQKAEAEPSDQQSNRTESGADTKAEQQDKAIPEEASEHLPTTIVVFNAFSSDQRKHFSDL